MIKYIFNRILKLSLIGYLCYVKNATFLQKHDDLGTKLRDVSTIKTYFLELHICLLTCYISSF